MQSLCYVRGLHKDVKRSYLTVMSLSLFFRSAFNLPFWAYESIYGEEDTSDLLCKRDENFDDERATI